MKKIFIQTEDNTIEHVVKNMLEREYQFSILVRGKEAHVSFRKGIWNIQVGKDLLTITDSPGIEFLNPNDPTLAELYIQASIARYQQLNSTTPWRVVPAAAIYDFINFRLGLNEADVSIAVHKSGRIKE